MPRIGCTASTCSCVAASLLADLAAPAASAAWAAAGSPPASCCWARATARPPGVGGAGSLFCRVSVTVSDSGGLGSSPSAGGRRSTYHPLPATSTSARLPYRFFTCTTWSSAAGSQRPLISTPAFSGSFSATRGNFTASPFSSSHSQ